MAQSGVCHCGIMYCLCDSYYIIKKGGCGIMCHFNSFGWHTNLRWKYYLHAISKIPC